MGKLPRRTSRGTGRWQSGPRGLTGSAKLAERQERAKPKVEAFLRWVDKKFEHHALLPSNPFLKALAYIRERSEQLKVYLNDPDVPIDTNHLERALRAVPMGRRNWLFCWTELGAKHIGMMQSLLTTCRLHDIDPYDYLVDVLQRIGQHPASRVEELTPRRWKQLYAANPLRSRYTKSRLHSRTPRSYRLRPVMDAAVIQFLSPEAKKNRASRRGAGL